MEQRELAEVAGASVLAHGRARDARSEAARGDKIEKVALLALADDDLARGDAPLAHRSGHVGARGGVKAR